MYSTFKALHPVEAEGKCPLWCHVAGSWAAVPALPGFGLDFTFIAAHVSLSLVEAAGVSGGIKTPVFRVCGAEKSQIAFMVLL